MPSTGRPAYRSDRFVTPEEFAGYESIARAKGFLMVSSSPLTRSSHHAGEDFARLQAARIARHEPEQVHARGDRDNGADLPLAQLEQVFFEFDRLDLWKLERGLAGRLVHIECIAGPAAVFISVTQFIGIDPRVGHKRNRDGAFKMAIGSKPAAAVVGVAGFARAIRVVMADSRAPHGRSSGGVDARSMPGLY